MIPRGSRIIPDGTIDILYGIALLPLGISIIPRGRKPRQKRRTIIPKRFHPLVEVVLAKRPVGASL